MQTPMAGIKPPPPQTCAQFLLTLCGRDQSGDQTMNKSDAMTFQNYIMMLLQPTWAILFFELNL